MSNSKTWREWLAFRVSHVMMCARCEPHRVEAETQRWEVENLRRELGEAYKLVESQRVTIEAYRESEHQRATTPAPEGRVHH